MTTIMITKEFLESKTTNIDYYNGGGGSGNINKIADYIYAFTVYNFLPGDNPHGFDGHYAFVVDITNFNYLVYKDSDYGGLTYVKEIDNKVFVDLHESMIHEVENIIASKLLGAYYYDGNHVNQQGPNLYPDKSDNPYYSGSKISLICTWVDDYPNTPLGQLEDIEKLAITTLINKRK